MARARVRRRSGRVALLWLLALGGSLGSAASAEEAREFTGRVKVGTEIERKRCTSCSPTEHETELENTLLDLVLSPTDRPDLSFGLELEHDIDGEGDIARLRLDDEEINDGVNVWVRRDFTDTWWARAQAEYESENGNLDVGGRIGFRTELTERTELSGYINLERRVPAGSESTANKGFYVEARLTYDWEIKDYGGWIEFDVERWFFDSSDVGDETKLKLKPGLWFDLGDSPHKGLIWFETERFSRSGDRKKTAYTNELGFGVELDLGQRRELLVGFVYGVEREKRPDRDTEKADLMRLILEYQFRF